ncbi:MAG: hypothetical protein D6B27_05375, partial [Gammaproteobacteria bacterium]
ERIFAPNELPNTENGTFTDNGRFFVASATAAPSTIYEITKSGNDTYVSQPLYTASDCMFSGLTSQGNILYASCSNPFAFFNPKTVLVRIDLDNGDKVDEASISGLKLPNGMAVDEDGSIYISDSQNGSFGATIAKITIEDKTEFTIQMEKWFTTSMVMANGIRIRNHILYLANQTNIRSIPILENGSAGNASIIYTAPTGSLIDDFCISGENFVAAEIPNPNGKSGKGKVKFISIDTGEVEKEYSAPTGYDPSSVSFDENGALEQGAFFVTDYYGGGLYIIH